MPESPRDKIEDFFLDLQNLGKSVTTGYARVGSLLGTTAMKITILTPLAIAAALLPLGSIAADSEVAPPAKPNIIVVLVDDMGWGDTTVYPVEKDARKSPRIPTPNLEKMAQRGVQLRRHYTAAPVCAPARASLFGGVHQGHTEVIRNNSFDAALENSHTLASVLREAGYATALIGKWGIGGGKESGGTPQTAAAWPTKRGFDYFFGYHNHLAGHRHYSKEETNADPDTGCNAIWDGDEVITENLDCCYSTDLFTARAKQWMIDHHKATPDKPFFLALTLIAPHARLAVPSTAYPKGGGLKGGMKWLGKPGKMINTATGDWDAFIDPKLKKDEKKWLSYAKENFPNGNAQQLVMGAQRHGTMITRVDAALGDIMALCKDLKIDKNTLVVFTSDNGPHNEPGAVRAIPEHPAPAQNPAFFRSYGDMDGIKRDVFAGGLRVPSLLYAPGITKAGSVSQVPCQFHDWMATFAELAGVPKPMRSDGVSLLPLLRGEKETAKPGIVYSEYAFGGGMAQHKDLAPNKQGRTRGEQQAIIFRAEDGRYLKALRTGIVTGDEDFEIYDIAVDSHEAKNIADEFPEMQQKLRTAVLYNRRAYDYARDPQAGKRNNACGGFRKFDGMLVPAETEVTAAKPGLTMRQLQVATPWVPDFDTLPGAADAVATHVDDIAALELPAGSVTELRGYINVPEDGNHWRFYLTLDDVAGSKAYMKMHSFQLIDADFNYKPGTTATVSSAANTEERIEEKTGKKGIPLAAGLHEITLVVVQGASAPGKVKLEWNRGPAGQTTPKQPIPARAFVTSAQ